MIVGKKTTLDEQCLFINGGAWNQDEYAESGVPVVQVTNMQKGTVVWEQVKYLPTSSLDRYSQNILEVHDLVIATVGSHPTQPNSVVGRATVIPDYAAGALLNQNAVCIRPKDQNLDKRYLGYLGKSAELHNYIISVARGAANQVRLAIGALKQFEFILPPLDTQRHIADILSAYDDLIENNRRRMALLEDAARQLYREWFVRLRFPGHEHTRITDGVPEGWDRSTAFSAMEVLSGGTPRTTVSDYWDGDLPFYTPKDATDTSYVIRTERSITELGLKNCSSRLYSTHTVFISARGTVGKLNLAARPMAMSQSCYALIGKEYVSQLFLFCALKEAIEYFKQHAVGAVFDAIVVDTFKLIPFTAPDVKLIRLFEDAVAPMFCQIANLMEQNEKLRTVRDLLLPRLMSQDIAI